MQAAVTRTERAARWLTRLGGAALLVGAIDPLEGSIVCLLGSGFLTAAAFVGDIPGAVRRRRLLGLGLIGAGVSALWIVSAAGGIGGTGGRSAWWALCFLPFPAGWALSVWDRTLPRWVAIGAAAVGLWYLALGVMIASKSGATSAIPLVLFAAGVGIFAFSLLRPLRRNAV